ncbi:MAG TPA: hypothetical protein VMU39_22340 [Solirubrobacteraceae bacterium]|nr:hypothetical protein [Solirubrobacteraceae bacterium]
MLLAAPAPALAAAAARPGWSQPFRMVAASSLDVSPPQAAFSSTGATALGFGLENLDRPGASSAFAADGASATSLGRPRRVTGAEQTLALAYSGKQLVLLVGTSPSGLDCCSAVAAVKAATSGAFGTPRTLVRGLIGTTTATLVTLPGRLLGAIATQRGVWVSQSGADGHFGPARQLTDSAVLAEALDATALGGNESAVAWAASSSDPTLPGATTLPGAQSIFLATGSVQRAPRSGTAVITVAPDHWIDELALAADGRVPTVAWVESWFDASGVYRSQLQVADLRGTVHALAISSAAELASGVMFAADTKGDQVLAWKGCTVAGTCVVRAALRNRGGGFTAPQLLGPADGSQVPAAAMGPGGQPVVGWIAHGHVLAAAGGAGARRLGAAKLVANTNYAADLSLAFNPLGQALATWTQGTLAQSVIGARYQTK